MGVGMEDEARTWVTCCWVGWGCCWGWPPPPCGWPVCCGGCGVTVFFKYYNSSLSRNFNYIKKYIKITKENDFGLFLYFIPHKFFSLLFYKKLQIKTTFCTCLSRPCYFLLNPTSRQQARCETLTRLHESVTTSTRNKTLNMHFVQNNQQRHGSGTGSHFRLSANAKTRKRSGENNKGNSARARATITRDTRSTLLSSLLLAAVLTG